MKFPWQRQINQSKRLAEKMTTPEIDHKIDGLLHHNEELLQDLSSNMKQIAEWARNYREGAKNDQPSG